MDTPTMKGWQSRGRTPRLARWLALPLLALALSSCQRSSPEQRLRAAVGELQAAIEQRDPASLEDRLAEDFVGPEGLDRGGARRLAQLMNLRHRNVDVALGPIQVDMQRDHATITFTALLTGGSGGLFPDSGRIYNVRTGWRMDDEEWRLTSAHWDAAARQR